MFHQIIGGLFVHVHMLTSPQYKYNLRGIRMYNTIIEFIPIGLSMVAIYFASGNHDQFHTTREKVVNVLGVIAAIILVVAQSSWYVSAVIEGNLKGTWFANQLWTIFNSLVMIMIIITTFPWDKK